MQEANEQADVIAFLRTGDWAIPAGGVEVIETHGALVFMAGETALKIKRAVLLPYLDFSTLELRRLVCERELAINRPLAPQIYLDVVPITRDEHDRLAVSGTGVPIEWAVRMVRFDQGSLLSHIAKTDGISRALAIALADMAFHYHRAATQSLQPADRVAETARDVMTALKRNADPKIAEAVRMVDAELTPALARCAAIRVRRASEGYVRRCHGDLHLGNIVLLDGKPVPFDAIEFDESLATIDTLYDLAFLLMDLERNGARVAANVVLNRYLWQRGDALDLEGLAALPAYLGLRAAIRSMAALDRTRGSTELGADTTAHVLNTLNLARGFLRQQPARLVGVGGLSGTGKSALAAAIAPFLGASPGAFHLRTDVERKRMAGIGEFDRLPPKAYTKAASTGVYRRVIESASLALGAGHSVIVDAVFADPGERASIEALATRTGVAFQGLWLEAPAHILRTRVEGRSGDASDATAAVVDEQLRYETGPISWTRIDASGTPQVVQTAGMTSLSLTAG
jgi:uncharacterized protein